MPGNGQRRRRVTYVLPLPTEPLPLLHLPSATVRRPGDPRPLIKRRDGLSPFAPPDPAHSVTTQQPAGHPQHRLGVNALALDVSTIVVSNTKHEPSPKGILYAGGRDGLLSAWELGLPMRKRRRRYGHSKRARVARSMRWGDMHDDEVAEMGSSDEDDEMPPRRDTASPDLAFGDENELLQPDSSHQRSMSPQLAYEERWEVDADVLQAGSETPPKTTFRQSVRPHSDWINAIALCNLNRTVVSASSDRTVRAWRPHDSYQSMRPTVLGQHTDYVKALAAPRNADWVASGGFDRMIKLWDINEGRKEALREFLAENSPSASVYCLATTPTGSLLASGSPENVVRLWDPRSGQQIGRLVGHSDNVRCLLISEDGSLLLSGSTDSDIKLWSTREQRCIETFSYHSSSVWSLFSNHPYLDTFYSGDRSGIVCKVDMDGCRDAADADCVVLLAEGDQNHDVSGADGINSIVAADDSYVWTATGSSTIMRWRDVKSRAARLKAAPASLLRASSTAKSPVDVFEDHEADAPLLQPTRKPFSPSVSFADHPSKPAQDLQKQFERSRSASFEMPDRSSMRPASPFAPASTVHRPLSLKLRGSANGPHGESALSPLSSSAGPSNGTPLLRGLPYESMVPLVSLDDPYLPRSHLHGEPLATTWSARSLSVHRFASSLTSVAAPSPRQEQVPDNPKERQAREQYELREEAADAVPLRLKPDEVLPGLRGLVASEVLNDRRHVITADKRGGIALWDVVLGVCLGAFDRNEVDSALGFAQGVPTHGQLRARPIKEALELVKERIEGEDATAAWSTIDVRSGCISVNLEETRVFEGEQYADEAGFADYLTAPHQRVNLGKTVLRALFDGYINEELRLHKNNQLPPLLSRHTSEISRLQRAAAPGHISLSGLRSSNGPAAGDLTAGGLSISLATPALTPVLPPVAADQKLRSRESILTPIPQSRQTTPPDASTKGNGMTTPRQSEGADYFSSPSSTSRLTSSSSISEPPGSPTVSSNSGLMGRLRGLGRKSKSGAPEPAASREEQEPPSKVVAANGVAKPSLTPEEMQQLEILRIIFSKPLAPCPAEEAPPIMLPPHVLIIIAEEAPESASWHSLYRGTAASMPSEIQCIEMSSPGWLLDFLLGNRTLQREPIKVAFVMTPWQGAVAAGVKEMPEGNNRLSANRVLRIAKVAAYCADRIGAASSDAATPAAPVLRAGSYTSLTSSMASQRSGDANVTAGDLEILVGDDVLPSTVTLAQALRFWQRKPGDLMLSFRLKSAPNDAVSRP